MRSKWDILQEKHAKASAEVAKLTQELKYLMNTPCKTSDGDHIRCSGCGREFKWESDFAKHYLVTDERYLNLGMCPDKSKS